MTANDIIQAALRRITAYQPGDQQVAVEANDALGALNDLLDSWSAQQYAVFGSVENILYYLGTTSTGYAYQYTIGTGGDFNIPRPLRITNAFTRITTQGSGYDYPIEILSKDRYVEYGLKSIPYPWPTALWYNPTYPLGNLYFFGAPNAGGELHLFTDTILGNLTLTQTFEMPQGYARAVKWALAREIALEYGFVWPEQGEKLYLEAFDVVKSLNAQPVPESNLDPDILFGDRTDAGWILFGGYR